MAKNKEANYTIYYGFNSLLVFSVSWRGSSYNQICLSQPTYKIVRVEVMESELIEALIG